MSKSSNLPSDNSNTVGPARLRLTKETVKSLSVKTGCQTGWFLGNDPFTIKLTDQTKVGVKC